MTITSQAFTGKANFTFNSDGTAKFSADNFNQKFTLSTDVSGQKLDIPITLNINGSSTAKYSVADNKITFSDQNQGDQKITVDTMGSASSIDGLLGKSGTMQLYQYTCTDANTLSLKVIAVKNVDLAPLTLTREK